MNKAKFKTPVAFLIFNRPSSTEEVFAEIAKAKPPKLLVVADGPREDHPGEELDCLAARAVIERVDWDCEVLKNFAEYNLGCRKRISTGLDWVFENVEEAIILEDDCVPHPTFFLFCEELLEKYRNDERVTMISGNNFQLGRRRTEYSYYFSRYCHIWGWATWKRAWQCFDIGMIYWPELYEGDWLTDLLGNNSAKYWRHILQLTYDGKINCWGYQWFYSCLVKGGLSVMPNVNLVSNIGFGYNATHTTTEDSTSNLPAHEIEFPLRHPPFLICDQQADNYEQKKYYNYSLYNRIKNKIKRTLSGRR